MNYLNSLITGVKSEKNHVYNGLRGHYKHDFFYLTPVRQTGVQTQMDVTKGHLIRVCFASGQKFSVIRKFLK